MHSPETSSIDVGIIELLDNYFEVIHAQDMNLFDQVFHVDCTLYGVKDNQTVLRPYLAYRDAVANRQSPKELGNPRKDEIQDLIYFCQADPDAVQALFGSEDSKKLRMQTQLPRMELNRWLLQVANPYSRDLYFFMRLA